MSRKGACLFPRLCAIALFFLLCFLLRAEDEAVAAPLPAVTAPLPVVVSIAPQKYLVERIAGNTVSVSVLVTPGSDPHSYEPTPAQMKDCANAALYFTIGLPFEDAWLPRLGGAVKDLKVASMIKGIQRLPSTDADGHPAGAHEEKSDHGKKEAHDADDHGHGHSREHGDSPAHGHGHTHEGEDPHVWLSPMLVRAMLPGIARELGRALPGQAPLFRANAEKLSAELEALDAELAQKFNAVPPDKRVFLTFHPAWRYFAYNYGLRELSIEVEGKEPGPKTMKAVVDAARTYGLTVIFAEPQFPKATAQAIAANIGAKVETLDPLAEDLPANLRHVSDILLASFTQ